MNKTEKIIMDMLCESTGKHMLDSGSAYGRFWEENQKNGPMTGPQKCDFWINEEEKTCELLPIVGIYDVFSEQLIYNKECEYLESLLPHKNYDILHYIEEQAKNENIISKSWYTDRVFNSYNSENALSQGYLGIFFKYNDEDYIAISIHNGCDIRGGYTDIHIFNVDIDEFVASHYDISIDCMRTNQSEPMCESGYQMYGDNTYYSHLEQKDVDEKYIFEHTYVDENGDLRCKECGGYVVCLPIQY